MAYQDWKPVVWKKTTTNKQGHSVTTERELNDARRRGEEITTEKKFLGGQNKSSKNICQNAAKIEVDTGDYHVDRVSHEFSEALKVARQKHNMTQAQLAQAINEKTIVITEYESGRGIPNGKIVQKLNKVLATTLPSTKSHKPISQL